MAGYVQQEDTFGSTGIEIQLFLLKYYFLRNELRPNPPINRNCNSPLRRLPQSGYWQRWASEAAAPKSARTYSTPGPPARHREDKELDQPALEALETKFTAANRGNPKSGMIRE